MRYALPYLRHRQRDGLANRFLAVQPILIFPINAELPRHHQFVVINRVLVLALDLHPLLMDTGPVFESFLDAAAERHVGIVSIPRPRQLLGNNFGPLIVHLWFGAAKIDRELKLDRTENIVGHARQMVVEQIDQRLAAIGAAGLGNHVELPVIGGTHAARHAALLDQLIGKREQFFLV